eukprot:13122052-Alexandrium_andersonii.AAC.1
MFWQWGVGSRVASMEHIHSAVCPPEQVRLRGTERMEHREDTAHTVFAASRLDSPSRHEARCISVQPQLRS